MTLQLIWGWSLEVNCTYTTLCSIFFCHPAFEIQMMASSLSFQFIACIGMVIWNFIVKEKDITLQILVFIFLYSSLYSTYLWTGMIFLDRTR